MFAASKTASVSGGYQISRSLRFNSADSAYLNRTPASAGNRKQWSWSLWFKVATVGTEIHFFGASQNSCYLRTDSTLQFIYGATNYRITSQVFRDVGAWMHLVVVWDSPNATVADRLRFYINGVQVTAFSTNNAVTLNDDSGINSVTAHNIGRFYGGSDYFNGYMTEINFIDGQALTASSFGETNAQTGVWSPIQYTGTYGTNGFYLNFSDNSNTTAATLGKDYSGNGNNWTPNNFSVTAGAGNDSLVDSPTSYGTDTGVGGTVRGNYCTINPLSAAGSTFTNGNLDVSVAQGGTNNAESTFAVSSGKWYWEVTPTSGATGIFVIGVIDIAGPTGARSYQTQYGWGYEAYAGFKGTNNSFSAYGASYAVNDVIGVALDMDAGTLVFYKNGTSQGTAFSTGIVGKNITPAFMQGSNSSGAAVYTANYGQRPFAYTAPSGFKALCTQNLPTPTIGATTATQAGKYFNPVLYTGDSAFSRSITGVGFQPDFTWIKSRTGGTYYHILTDAVRGVNSQLFSNDTLAQESRTDRLTAFNSDGFSIGSYPDVNLSTGTYVAWNWKANGSGSTNTSGTITSTVSANTTAGFSVVTYTNASSGTVGHGLGVAPAMVIYKDRTNVTNWIVLHQSLANMSSSFLVLNLTNAVGTLGTALGGNPTSSVIYTNTSIIQNGAASVAYCFAEVAGYSKFGSYTGNGSTDGPFCFTGMRPAYILVKCSSTTGPWDIFDDTRSPTNVASRVLYANTSDAEGGIEIDILSNGFKIRDTSGNVNTNGATYIFMALAENPFKYSLAR